MLRTCDSMILALQPNPTFSRGHHRTPVILAGLINDLTFLISRDEFPDETIRLIGLQDYLRKLEGMRKREDQAWRMDDTEEYEPCGIV